MTAGETTSVAEGEGAPVAALSFAAALRLWLKVGSTSFGGPAGQIAILHEELVDRRRWVGGSVSFSLR